MQGVRWGVGVEGRARRCPGTVRARGQVPGPERQGARAGQRGHRAVPVAPRRRPPGQAHRAGQRIRAALPRVRRYPREAGATRGRGAVVRTGRGVRESRGDIHRHQALPPRQAHHAEGVHAQAPREVRQGEGERG